MNAAWTRLRHIFGAVLVCGAPRDLVVWVVRFELANPEEDR